MTQEARPNGPVGEELGGKWLITFYRLLIALITAS